MSPENERHQSENNKLASRDKVACQRSSCESQKGLQPETMREPKGVVEDAPLILREA